MDGDGVGYEVDADGRRWITQKPRWIQLPDDYFVDGCRCEIRFSGELVPNDCPIEGHPCPPNWPPARMEVLEEVGGIVEPMSLTKVLGSGCVLRPY